MIVTCDNCRATLQIDETKASSDRFAVRCPKCQYTITIDLKNIQSFDNLPTENQSKDFQPPQNFTFAARNWEEAPAAAFGKNAGDNNLPSAPENTQDLLRLLGAALQQQNFSSPANQPNQTTHLKRVLLCLTPERRENSARLLDEVGYNVFIADNPAQATEKIRDEEVDIIIYSPDFALKFGGASVIQKMLHNLLARERRRLFVVSIEEGSQTFNTHEAFLRNLNLIVNTGDLHHLPSILNRAVRDYDELFRHFNQALNSVN